MKLHPFIAVIATAVAFASCKISDKNWPATVNVNFIFKFDSTQVRLNGIGAPVGVPAGNGAQSPRFNKMSAHYVELTPTAFTALGTGAVVYRAAEVGSSPNNAIDFSKASFAGNNETFLSIPLSQLAAGTYTYLRVSLAYQNYNVYISVPGQTINATVASFIGFNTYIGSYKIKDSTVIVNDNKKHGYWAVEASVPGFGFVTSGQAPQGATTVPNPLFATSAVPAFMCCYRCICIAPCYYRQ
jgi:hypothetical protein